MAEPSRIRVLTSSRVISSPRPSHERLAELHQGPAHGPDKIGVLCGEAGPAGRGLAVVLARRRGMDQRREVAEAAQAFSPIEAVKRYAEAGESPGVPGVGVNADHPIAGQPVAHGGATGPGEQVQHHREVVGQA